MVGTYLHPCSIWAGGGGLWPTTRDHLRSICEGLCCCQDSDGSFPSVSRSYFFPSSLFRHLADETDLCYRVDTDRDGWIQINYEQFMKVCFRPSLPRRTLVSNAIRCFRSYSALPENRLLKHRIIIMTFDSSPHPTPHLVFVVLVIRK